MPVMASDIPDSGSSAVIFPDGRGEATHHELMAIVFAANFFGNVILDI
jgi:hypothetical protein